MNFYFSSEIDFYITHLRIKTTPPTTTTFNSKFLILALTDYVIHVSSFRKRSYIFLTMFSIRDDTIVSDNLFNRIYTVTFGYLLNIWLITRQPTQRP